MRLRRMGRADAGLLALWVPFRAWWPRALPLCLHTVPGLTAGAEWLLCTALVRAAFQLERRREEETVSSGFTEVCGQDFYWSRRAQRREGWEMGYYHWWGSRRVGFSPLGREDVRLVPVLSGAGWGVGDGEWGVRRRVGGAVKQPD